MPIMDQGNGLTHFIDRESGELLSIIPTQLMQDLRGVALMDGIKQAQDDRWLAAEIRLAGEVIKGGNEICWNCKGTLGFYAPTGDKDNNIAHYRPTGHDPSPLRRKWNLYPCPACQNPLARLKEDLRIAGILDPDLVLYEADDIWWDKPGRETMGAGVKGLIKRIMNNQIGGIVTLAGAFGCGKSTLGKHVVYQSKRTNRDALYITAERFKDAVKASFGSEDDPSGFFQRLRTAPIVVMDQIDWLRETTSGGQQSYAAEVFRDIFNHRYEMRRLCCTVFIVNLEAWHKGGEGMLDAIYDRMNEGEVYIAEGKGTRREIAQTQIDNGDGIVL